MIKPFQLELPPEHGCEVVGFLYDADQPEELGQDMIEVQLPNGITIDAGWYPEGDPAGSYVVKVWHPRGVELPPSSFARVSDAAAAISLLVSTGAQSLPECAIPSRPQL